MTAETMKRNQLAVLWIALTVFLLATIYWQWPEPMHCWNVTYGWNPGEPMFFAEGTGEPIYMQASYWKAHGGHVILYKDRFLRPDLMINRISDRASLTLADAVDCR